MSPNDSERTSIRTLTTKNRGHDPDQFSGPSRNLPCAMTRYDWKYRLSLAVTLTLAVGAICVLLFAM
jgi:hypothetical protein